MNRPTLSLPPDVESRWKEKQSVRDEKMRRRREGIRRAELLRRLQDRTAAERNADGGAPDDAPKSK